MLRSMYSGVSGLKVHQTKMDVIGDNIANVNTTAFKSSSVKFKDLFSQTINNAQAPQGGRGGINPRQIGLGVTVGSIDVDQTQGNLQSTGKDTDLAIDGNGYFVVNDGTQDLYTRAGNLGLDNDGNLINAATGYKVQGWLAEKGEINTDTEIDDIKINIGENMDARASSEVSFGGNLDSRVENGVSRSASIEVFDSNGGQHTVNLDFTRSITTELVGEIDIDGNTLTIDQMTADPAMDGMNIEFQDNGGQYDVSYENGKVLVAGDWDGSDTDAPVKTVDQIQEDINTALNEAGFTGALELTHAGASLTDDLDNDSGSWPKSLTLNQPEFTVGSNDYNLRIKQDVNNPDPALNKLKVKFNDDGTATSLSGTYNESDHEINLTADWSGGVEFSEVEEKINEVLEDDNFDGRINLDALDSDNIIQDVDSDNITSVPDSLKISASNHWDWGSTNISDAVDGTDNTGDSNYEPVYGQGTIAFDSNGQILNTSNNGEVTFDPIDNSSKNPASEQTVTIDFSSISQLATSSTLEGIKADGYESGSLNSFSINDNGVITGGYSNGVNNDLGQIAIAKFANPDGLKKEGDSMFAQSKNSGNAVVGVANNGGRGVIKGETLEMSNVDLAKQFTEMITTQRGFQANSKIISTSDQMLQDLVNLKR